MKIQKLFTWILLFSFIDSGFAQEKKGTLKNWEQLEGLFLSKTKLNDTSPPKTNCENPVDQALAEIEAAEREIEEENKKIAAENSQIQTSTDLNVSSNSKTPETNIQVAVNQPVSKPDSKRQPAGSSSLEDAINSQQKMSKQKVNSTAWKNIRNGERSEALTKLATDHYDPNDASDKPKSWKPPTNKGITCSPKDDDLKGNPDRDGILYARLQAYKKAHESVQTEINAIHNEIKLIQKEYKNKKIPSEIRSELKELRDRFNSLVAIRGTLRWRMKSWCKMSVDPNGVSQTLLDEAETAPVNQSTPEITAEIPNSCIADPEADTQSEEVPDREVEKIYVFVKPDCPECPCNKEQNGPDVMIDSELGEDIQKVITRIDPSQVIATPFQIRQPIGTISPISFPKSILQPTPQPPPQYNTELSLVQQGMAERQYGFVGLSDMSQGVRGLTGGVGYRNRSSQTLNRIVKVLRDQKGKSVEVVRSPIPIKVPLGLGEFNWPLWDDVTYSVAPDGGRVPIAAMTNFFNTEAGATVSSDFNGKTGVDLAANIRHTATFTPKFLMTGESENLTTHDAGLGLVGTGQLSVGGSFGGAPSGQRPSYIAAGLGLTSQGENYDLFAGPVWGFYGQAQFNPGSFLNENYANPTGIARTSEWGGMVQYNWYKENQELNVRALVMGDGQGKTIYGTAGDGRSNILGELDVMYFRGNWGVGAGAKMTGYTSGIWNPQTTNAQYRMTFQYRY